MVLGALIFFGLGVYLIISLLVIWQAMGVAKRKGKSTVRWGWIAAIIMYLLLFWDWIPAEIFYNYSCSQKAGFNQYKSLAQWKQENPDMAETLTPSNGDESSKNINHRRYLLNQRFALDVETIYHMLGVKEYREDIVDIKMGAVLASYVDFDARGNQNNIQGLRDLKFWMGRPSCEEDGKMPNQIIFNDFYLSIKNIGKISSDK